MSEEIDILNAKVQTLEDRLLATQDAVAAALIQLARADNHGAVQQAVNVFREECDK